MLGYNEQTIFLQLLANGEIELAAKYIKEKTMDNIPTHVESVMFCYRIKAIEKRERKGDLKPIEAQIRLNLIALGMLTLVFDNHAGTDLVIN